MFFGGDGQMDYETVAIGGECLCFDQTNIAGVGANLGGIAIPHRLDTISIDNKGWGMQKSGRLRN